MQLEAKCIRDRRRAYLREDPAIPNDIVRISRKWQELSEPKYGVGEKDNAIVGEEDDIGIEQFLRSKLFR